jgi:hypothetical protein
MPSSSPSLRIGHRMVSGGLQKFHFVLFTEKGSVRGLFFAKFPRGGRIPILWSMIAVAANMNIGHFQHTTWYEMRNHYP